MRQIPDIGVLYLRPAYSPGRIRCRQSNTIKEATGIKLVFRLARSSGRLVRVLSRNMGHIYESAAAVLVERQIQGLEFPRQVKLYESSLRLPREILTDAIQVTFST